MPDYSQGITLAAAKSVLKYFTEQYKNIGEEARNISIESIVEDTNLWMVDEWTHVGNIIVVCLNNLKMVENYKKGNVKVFEALLGLTIKYSNMTVDPSLIRELLPMVIDVHF